MMSYNEYWGSRENVENLDVFWSKEEERARRERAYRLVRGIPEKGGTVLDAGAGCLQDYPFLVNNGWHYTGSDSSKVMLAYASELYPNTCLIDDDIVETKLADNSFDLVYSASVICHLPLEMVNTAIGNMMKISRKHLIIYTPYVHELPTTSTFVELGGYIRNRFNFTDLYERISAVGDVIHIERGDDVVAIHALKREEP